MSNKKIVNYFSHDENAQDSTKMLRCRMEHGAAGYGIYFMIIERMRREPDYMLKADFETLAYALREDVELVRSVIEDFGFFEKTEDGLKFYSRGFLERMGMMEEKRQKRVAAGRKGAMARHGIKEKKDSSANDDAMAMQPKGDSNAIANAKQTQSNATASEEQRLSDDVAIKTKIKTKTKIKLKDSTTDADASDDTPIDSVEEKPKKQPALKQWERRAKKSKGFQQFVSEYPEHRSLGQYRTFLAWERQGIDGDPELFEKTMKWLRSWVASDDWTKDGGKYVPNMDKFMDQYWGRMPRKNQSNWKGNQGRPGTAVKEDHEYTTSGSAQMDLLAQKLREKQNAG